MNLRGALLCAMSFLCLVMAPAQTGADYDTLIQQGKAQLQASDSAGALATGQQAIKLDANRWEAYALAGGALMNLKRYDEAIDDFSKSIDHAPAEKQEGLRNLRKQCFVAETGAVTPPAQPSAIAPTQPAPATQAEIVLWKSIESSANPADFQSYLDQYPHGAFAILAQRHLVDLKASAEQEQRALKSKADHERQDSINRLTWTDSSTGLMWAKLDMSNPDSTRPRNFSEAVDYCSGLQLLQLTGWRLPTADELQPISSTASDFVAHEEIGRDVLVPELWTSTEAPKGGQHLMVLGGKRFTGKDKTGGVLAHYPGGKQRAVSGNTVCVRNTKSDPSPAE